MSLTKAIRLSRFRVKDGKKIQAIIESKTGKIFTFAVIDCSMSGFAASTDSSKELTEDVLEDDILPAARLVFGETEVTLGRVAVKRLQSADGAPTSMAFSTIDTRIPLDGPLSTYLEVDISKGQTAFTYELGANHFSLANFIGSDFSNVDIFERTKKFSIFYTDWKKSEKFGYFMARESSQGARIKLSKKRKGGRNDYIMMGSNDYLGLASRPEIKKAAMAAIEEYGFGSTGTPHTSGSSVLHEQLAKRVAQLYGKEDAIIYASGYAANVGIVSGLCREQDLIIADMISHASLHDGINMSRATSRLFKHNDMKHLKRILDENRAKHNGCLIITEGAFSMDGTIGKLDEVYRLAKEYNARVLIDQAHCLGVVGKTGLGTVEKYNLIEETDIIMGLFSKALGSVGGFVTGSSEMIDWLRFFSRSYMFATTVPPSTAAATLKAFDIMLEEDLIAKLQSNIRHFISSLRALGAPLDPSHETAIIPLEIRNEAKMGKMFQSLLNDGVFVIPIVYPVVARNRCRFRFSVRADLSISDLDYVVSSIEKAMKVADFSFDQIRDDGPGEAKKSVA